MKVLSKASLAILWGYAAELVLAAAITGLVLAFWDHASIDSFLAKTISDWLTVTGQVLFPAAVAIWITYVNLESSEFGDYLRHEKVEGAYSLAFRLPAIVFFSATIVLVVYRGVTIQPLLYVAVFLLSYSLALVLSLVSNVTAVIRLYRHFKIELECERLKIARSIKARSRSKH